MAKDTAVVLKKFSELLHLLRPRRPRKEAKMGSLSQHLSSRRVHGSRRRGRNTSNLWFAKQLAAMDQLVKPHPAPLDDNGATGRVQTPHGMLCGVCGRDIRGCKGTGPAYALWRKRLTAMTFVG